MIDLRMLPKVNINMTEAFMQEAYDTFVISADGQIYEDDLWKPIREHVAREFNAEDVNLSLTAFYIDDIVYYPNAQLKHWLERYVKRLLAGNLEPLDTITMLFKDDGYISALEF